MFLNQCLHDLFLKKFLLTYSWFTMFTETWLSKWMLGCSSVFGSLQGLGRGMGRERRRCFGNTEEAPCQAQKQQQASVSHNRLFLEGVSSETLWRRPSRCPFSVLLLHAYPSASIELRHISADSGPCHSRCQQEEGKWQLEQDGCARTQKMPRGLVRKVPTL